MTPIGPRPCPELYRRAQSPANLATVATYGRELLRVVGGLPDPPHKLEAARVDLLRALMSRASRKASGVRDVAAVLEIKGRASEAAFVRRWAGMRDGREKIAAECHYAAQMGATGILRARALGWARKRL